MVNSMMASIYWICIMCRAHSIPYVAWSFTSVLPGVRYYPSFTDKWTVHSSVTESNLDLSTVIQSSYSFLCSTLTKLFSGNTYVYLLKNYIPQNISTFCFRVVILVPGLIPVLVISISEVSQILIHLIL